VFEKILLPLDGSELGRQIIPYVAQIAKALGSTVTALHVGPSEAAATAFLQEAEHGLLWAGVPAVDSRWSAGDPAAEIARHAEQHECDLLAMATHGRSGLNRLVCGSTTDRVLHSTRLPMLLLRPSDHGAAASAPLHTAIVPLDGSALAARALPPVAQLARQLGLIVELVRVVGAPALAAVHGESYSLSTPIGDDEEAAASAYLEAASAQLRRQGVLVAWRPVRGDPAERITAVAERTPGSLVVMSTHGRAGMGRLILGSVADEVLRASSRPVLLFRM